MTIRTCASGATPTSPTCSRARRYSLVPNLLGYEWDSDVENGFRPAGLINMSLSTVSVDTYLRDYGTTVGAARRDAQPDHVPGRKRRAGLRSRHRLLVLGSRFQSRGRGDAHRPERPAGDGQHVRRHGHPADDAGGKPDPGDAIDGLRPSRPRRSRLRPSARASSKGRKSRSPAPLRISAAASSPASKSRSTAARAGGRRRAARTGATAGTSQASGTYTIRSRAVDDSVNLENAVRRRGRSRSTCLRHRACGRSRASRRSKRRSTATRVTLGVTLPGDDGWLCQRHPLLQGLLQYRRARRRSVDVDGHAAGHRRVSRAKHLGLADGDVLVSGAHRPPERPMSPPTTPTATIRRQRQLSSRRPTRTGSSVRAQAAASMPTAAAGDISEQRPATARTTGWMSSSTRIPTRRRVANNDSGFSVTGKNGTLAISFAAACGQRHRSERRRR